MNKESLWTNNNKFVHSF